MGGGEGGAEEIRQARCRAYGVELNGDLEKPTTRSIDRLSGYSWQEFRHLAEWDLWCDSAEEVKDIA